MAANGQLTVAAILVAAGDGRRLGSAVPKAFCEVRGRTLLEHALGPFVAHAAVRDLVVVAPAALLERCVELTGAEVTVVAGGATRQASVRAGLAALAPDVDAVLVHDVARPFVPIEVLDRVLAALAGGAVAVIPARPVTDTIKRVDAGQVVAETLDRSTLRAVQTPQGFDRAVLVAAHDAAPSDDVTDDAGLVEVRGGTVVVVDGADEAFKITRPWDLVLAEAVTAR
ncbi:MAG TPA: 2-C-methyl-D-erythritol 4-phosphate cytidylyltransferase [Jatrophihabitantaceae bacterium]|nr:2-C-methyl-D-erythritol 4-phosphate cytidylyltransferase [Jatrophihabitantaceae bacterium]